VQLPVLPSHPECTACDLHLTISPTHFVGVPSRWLEFSLPPGPNHPGVVFLGQNPGAQESKANKAFIGPSGKVVEASYIRGISLETQASIYLSNTARCFTPAEAPPKDRHYKACFPHFLSDLEQIARLHTPSRMAVVCLGAPAARFFYQELTGQKLNQKQAFAHNGSRHTWRGWPLHFFAVYHPAACLRKRSLIHIVADHMDAVRRFLQGENRDSGPLRIHPRLPLALPAQGERPAEAPLHPAHGQEDQEPRDGPGRPAG